VSKILRADDIVWYNCADGSWGGCESDDLVIVRLADMTEDERALLGDAEDAEAREAIVGAYERMESYKRHHPEEAA
jgi:hypothetical protein